MFQRLNISGGLHGVILLSFAIHNSGMWFIFIVIIEEKHTSNSTLEIEEKSGAGMMQYSDNLMVP